MNSWTFDSSKMGEIMQPCRISGDHDAQWIVWRGDSTSEVLNNPPSYYCKEHLWLYEMACEMSNMEYQGTRRVYVIQPLVR